MMHPMDLIFPGYTDRRNRHVAALKRLTKSGGFHAKFGNAEALILWLDLDCDALRHIRKTILKDKLAERRRRRAPQSGVSGTITAPPPAPNRLSYCPSAWV